MSTSDLTQSQLDTLLDVDTTVLNETDQYLTAHKLVNDIVNQNNDFPPFTPDASGHLPQTLELSLLNESNQTIDTSTLGDPALKALFVANGLTETVTGDHSLLIATDQDANTLLLNDMGNDVVLVGDGNNHVNLGGGSDLLLGGGGFEQYTGGTGAHQTIVAGVNSIVEGGVISK
jgi:hypothetical protein